MNRFRKPMTPFFEHLYNDAECGRTIDHASSSPFNEPCGNWSSSDPLGI